MRGYTEHVAKMMVEESKGYGLGVQVVHIEDKSEKSIQKGVSELGFDKDYVANDDMVILLEDEILYLDEIEDGDSLELVKKDKGYDLVLTPNEYTMLDECSEGGLQVIAKDNEPVGFLCNVCGEHLGSVSTTLNTYTGEVKNVWGYSGFISKDDCDKINIYLDDYQDLEECLSSLNLDSYLDTKGNSHELESF